MTEVKASIHINAPIEKVWAEITHHEGMIHWPSIQKVVIDQKGKDHPDGLGCIRSVNMPGMFVKEEITRFDVNKRMDYLVIETDQPFKHHGGTMKLDQKRDSVQLVWTSRLDMTSKNPIIRFIGSKVILKKGNKGFARGLQYIKQKLETQERRSKM